MDKPLPCQICGKQLDDNPIKTESNSCEHSRPPQYEQEVIPIGGKQIHCQMCQGLYSACSWLNLYKKLKLRRNCNKFMKNPYENYYKCTRCWYGVRI